MIYAVASLGDRRNLCADCRRTSPPCQDHPAAGRKHPAPAVSVKDMPGRSADAAVTRAQIGTGVLMSCGARDLVKDDPNGLLMFRVGPNGKRVCKVLVRLLPSDEYAAEFGYSDMRPSRPHSPEWGVWQTVEQVTGVYAENLAATVRRLGDRERY